MFPVRSIIVVSLLAPGVFAADGDESPRALVEAAIKAHGGAAAIDKTNCANLHAKAKVDLGPGMVGRADWEGAQRQYGPTQLRCNWLATSVIAFAAARSGRSPSAARACPANATPIASAGRTPCSP
jgi:hypothetical protein